MNEQTTNCYAYPFLVFLYTFLIMSTGIPYFLATCWSMNKQQCYITTSIDMDKKGQHHIFMNNNKNNNGNYNLPTYVNSMHCPCDQSLPTQPISIQRAQPRKKAHIPLHTLQISPKMCLPCLIIMQSSCCHYRINRTFICSCCLICMLNSGHLISTHYARKGFLAFFS